LELPAATHAGVPAKPLTPEEKKYLCYSVADGVGKYMDLLSDESFDYRAKDASAPHPRADYFAARFITLYTEGQKALFMAAGTLDESGVAEDDAIQASRIYRPGGTTGNNPAISRRPGKALTHSKEGCSMQTTSFTACSRFVIIFINRFR
jgi:hypothetical protein